MVESKIARNADSETEADFPVRGSTAVGGDFLDGKRTIKFRPGSDGDSLGNKTCVKDAFVAMKCSSTAHVLICGQNEKNRLNRLNDLIAFQRISGIFVCSNLGVDQKVTHFVPAKLSNNTLVREWNAFGVVGWDVRSEIDSSIGRDRVILTRVCQAS